MDDLGSDPLEVLRRARDDFEFFCEKFLTVRNKEGQFVPFVLNPAQRVLHDTIEAQKAEKGWVRAIILKGRQQGISTYVAARFYWQASLHRGVNVFILSHEQTATDTLFGIVDRYQRNNPIAPHVGASNAKELEFDKLDSSYAVATAGNKATGRSKALSLFHGSEVAFWNNAADHFAASVQGVSSADGTEVILESTSAGAEGEYFERYQDAQAGKGDYIPIFLEWWLSPEYQRDPPPGFTLKNEPDEEGGLSEVEYQSAYNVPLAAMVWRRAKLAELRNPLLFRREYPAEVSEAWTAPPDHIPFIDPMLVLRARKREVEAAGPLIIGVDPASGGGDRFAVAWRRGYSVIKVETRNKINHLEAVEWMKEIIDQDRPARVNIDQGNIGGPLVTTLKASKPEYVNIVRGVNFGSKSQAKMARPKVPGPTNRRAEMWGRCLEWLEGEIEVSLPDLDMIQADLTAPKREPLPNNDYQLESKKKMKARNVRSPDIADAICLTFASVEYFTDYYDPGHPVNFGNVDDPRTQVADEGYGQTYGGGSYSWMG